jgi:hypothetical protein
LNLHAGAQAASERIALLANQKREPGVIGQTFRQPYLHARAVCRAAFTPAQRCGQCTTGIENKEVARPKVIVDLIEASVLNPARCAIDYQQANLITPDAPTFWRLFCAQLRGKCESKRRAHFILSS